MGGCCRRTTTWGVLSSDDNMRGVLSSDDNGGVRSTFLPFSNFGSGPYSKTRLVSREFQVRFFDFDHFFLVPSPHLLSSDDPPVIVRRQHPPPVVILHFEFFFFFRDIEKKISKKKRSKKKIQSFFFFFKRRGIKMGTQKIT